MKSACALLALWVAGSSLSAFAAETVPSGSGPRGTFHACCCARCPGPGLCPCDLGAGGEGACLRSPDDAPQRAISLPGLRMIKLACEVPEPPQAPAFEAFRPEPSAAPALPVDLRTVEKVPIRPL